MVGADVCPEREEDLMQEVLDAVPCGEMKGFVAFRGRPAEGGFKISQPPQDPGPHRRAAMPPPHYSAPTEARCGGSM